MKKYWLLIVLPVIVLALFLQGAARSESLPSWKLPWTVLFLPTKPPTRPMIPRTITFRIMKPRLPSTRIIIACLLLSGTVFGQNTQKIYPEGFQQALLDTAIRFELLKPAHVNLKKSHEYLSRENESLRQAIRLRDLQMQLFTEHYEALLAGAERRRRRARWLGRLEGFGAGLLVPIP